MSNSRYLHLVIVIRSLFTAKSVWKLENALDILEIKKTTVKNNAKYEIMDI